MTKGIHSSEFWMSAMTILGIAGSVLAGISAPWAVAAAAVVNGIYTYSRTQVKTAESKKAP